MKIEPYLEKITALLVEYTPKVIIALLVLLIGLWVIKRVAIIAEKAMKRRDLDVSLRTFLKSLVSIGLKIMLIVTVAGMIGIGTASFVTILGAAGLAIGLALQGSLSNFAGGVLILIFKPYKVGDTIEAQGQTGEVKEIQVFNTLVLTADHKTVILPNGALSNGTIVNYSRHGNLRADIQLNISVDNDLEKVKRIIYAELEANDKVLKEPEAGIFIGKVTDGAILVQVRPFCLIENQGLLTSELYATFKNQFEIQEVKQPLPKRAVYSLEG